MNTIWRFRIDLYVQLLLLSCYMFLFLGESEMWKGVLASLTIWQLISVLQSSIGYQIRERKRVIILLAAGFCLLLWADFPLLAIFTSYVFMIETSADYYIVSNRSPSFWDLA